jgi:hypothetical protein
VDEVRTAYPTRRYIGCYRVVCSDTGTIYLEFELGTWNVCHDVLFGQLSCPRAGRGALRGVLMIYIIGFLVALALSALFIVAITHFSVWAGNIEPQNEIEEDKYRDQEKQKRYGNTYQSDANTVSARLDTISDQIEALRKHSDYHDRKRAVREIVGVGAASIAAALAFITAIFFYLQFKEMQSDQRPWVGMSTLQAFPDDPVQPVFFIGFSIKNVGKSPAFDVSVNILNWNQSADPPPIPRKKCTSDCFQGKMVMIPGSETFVRIPQVGDPRPAVGQKVWVIARVDYRDEDRIWHNTGVCFTAIVNRVFDAAVNRYMFAATSKACTIDDSNYAD